MGRLTWPYIALAPGNGCTVCFLDASCALMAGQDRITPIPIAVSKNWQGMSH